jgi:hypothetical protein
MSIILCNAAKAENILPENIIYNPFLLNTRFYYNQDLLKQIKAALLFYEKSTDAESIIKGISKYSFNPIKYIPEIKDVSISGKLVYSLSQEAVPGKLIYSSVIQKLPQIHISRTDSSGNFYFNLNHLYDMQDVYLGFDESDTTDCEMLINSDFLTKYPDFKNLTPDFSPADSVYLANLLINATVSRNYFTDSVVSCNSNPRKYGIFGTLPKRTLLSDYIELINLEEVFNEIIPYTKIRTVKNEKKCIVYDRQLSYNYDNPLILVDNIPIFNVNHVLEIPPNKVEEIGIINKTYLLGNNFLKGIVLIKTKTENFGGVKMPNGSNFFEYTTLSSQSYPSINTQKENKFSNLIYFNANLNLDNKGKKVDIKLPDNQLDYVISLSGKDEDGNFYEFYYPL